MSIFLFLGSRRGFSVLKTLVEAKTSISGILCLVEDPHEEAFHPKIKKIAEEHQIPFYSSTDIKPADYETLLKKIKPDVAFAIGWRYLINKAAYSIPSKGTLILHDSLLPRYRGFAPMNWAIINGESKTGVTLFYIADGVDSGPIVDQLETTIERHDTAKTVDEKIIALYNRIILKNIEAIISGKAKKTEQNESEASYTCKRTPEDGRINWNKSAWEIYNLIRGLTHPFPGAFTTLKDKKLYIWEAELPSIKQHYVGAIPGRIIGKHNGMIDILTGDGVLSLKQLQYENEEIMNATDFNISVKDTFGINT